MVNTVHDSIVSDAHPSELEEMLDIHDNIGYATKELLKEMYDIDFNLDLDVETKFGENWLDLK
jgi:DNA polymerase I-like protein with 3'-5' exonuclease and polymerase domains